MISYQLLEVLLNITGLIFTTFPSLIKPLASVPCVTPPSLGFWISSQVFNIKASENKEYHV